MNLSAGSLNSEIMFDKDQWRLNFTVEIVQLHLNILILQTDNMYTLNLTFNKLKINLIYNKINTLTN